MEVGLGEAAEADGNWVDGGMVGDDVPTVVWVDGVAEGGVVWPG